MLEYITERDEDKRYPVCIAGENACPPEDCGGPRGYTDVLDIIGNPAHEEYHQIKTWLGKGFNQTRFNIESVNRKLLSMRLK
jgi:hypothetical protein